MPVMFFQFGRLFCTAPVLGRFVVFVSGEIQICHVRKPRAESTESRETEQISFGFSEFFFQGTFIGLMDVAQACTSHTFELSAASISMAFVRVERK